MPLSAQSLFWVKNVKTNDGNDWAYMDDEHQNEFLLHFSKHWRIGADIPKVGETILLFQTVDMPNYNNIYLTHLVTPIYEQGEDTRISKFPRARWVKVIDRASLPNPVKAPRELIFFKPNRGYVFNLTLIERDNGFSRRNGEKIPLLQLQEIIWKLFDGHFHPSNNA